MELLHALLHSGIETTLHEADEKEALEPPYGRKTANPLPKSDEDGGGLDEDDPWADVEEDEDEEEGEDEEDEEEETKFEYTYGFNPLLFLGEYLQTTNPKVVRERAIARQGELRAQAKQAEVLRVRQDTFKSLSSKVSNYVDGRPAGIRSICVTSCFPPYSIDRNRLASYIVQVREMRSGISLGPICNSTSGLQALLWVKTLVPGTVVFEVFLDEAYTTSFETQKSESFAASGRIASTTLEQLQSNTTYYYRACVKNDSFKLPGPSGGFFACGKFTSLPESDENTRLTFCAVGAPVAKASSLEPPGLNPWMATVNAIAAFNPSLVVINGGVLPRSLVRSINTKVGGRTKIEEITRLYEKQLGDAAMRRLLSSHLILFGLDDDSVGSAAALKAEEAATEEKNKDYSKGPSKKGKKGKRGTSTEEKKLEADPRGDLTPAMKARLACLPLKVEDLVTRHTFSRSRYGRQADFFLLDTREGAVGRTQTAWLNNALTGSGCTWKFVVVPSLVSSNIPPPAIGGGANGGGDSRPSSKERKIKGSSVSAGAGDPLGAKYSDTVEADLAGERQISEEKDNRTLTVADTVRFVVEEGITGVIFLTSDERQISAIEYNPKVIGERVETGACAPSIYTFGIGPFGPGSRSAGNASKRRAFTLLRPTFLLPDTTQIFNGAATFAKIEISGSGSLTYNVCNDLGVALQSVTVEPTSRSD